MSVILMPPQQYAAFVRASDRYGIIRSRKALARVLPGVKIDRGLERWMLG